jgi:hypothetical protein
MRDWFGKSVLALASLFCLLTAASSGIAPRQFAAHLGFDISGASGYNEIRAQYAGFFLVVGAICVAALLGYVTRRSAYFVLAVLFGGLIIGRLGSVAINRGLGGYTSTIVALYAIDATAFLLSILAIALEREARQLAGEESNGRHGCSPEAARQL